MNRVTAAVTCVVLVVSLRSSIFLKANVLVVAQWFRNFFFFFEIFNIIDKTIDWVFVRKKRKIKLNSSWLNYWAAGGAPLLLYLKIPVGS